MNAFDNARLTSAQEQNLGETRYFDFSNPGIASLAARLVPGCEVQMARDIYLMVRDEFPYNPYRFVDGERSFRASYCIDTGEGYCITKAALMVALCRNVGIAAKIGFADVKNHLSSPKLQALLQSDVFTMHAYADVYLNGRWVKATPAFNKSLCDKFGIEALEFDGENDSMFQPYTSDGSMHMEYLKQHGSFSEMPVELIMKNVALHYPHLTEKMGSMSMEGALEDE